MSISVNWSVENESSVKEYELQRSIDSILFNGIDVLDAINNEDDAFYQRVDKKPADADNFYRIKFTDYEGKTGYSNTVKVDDLKLVPSFSIYPNPVVNDQIYLNLVQQPSGKYSWELMNETGQLETAGSFWINSRVEKQLIKLPATMLPGNYILTVYYAGKFCFSAKAVIK